MGATAARFCSKLLSNVLHFIGWSKQQLVSVLGLAACVVLLVPSTGAPDALKTWTCLLKECR
jgi:violaxanthin de-epoxidase